MVSDQLDVGVLGFTNAVTWSAQGADLKIIGKVQEGYHSLIARNDRGIKTLKDLKGKSIASQSAGSTADIVLKGVVLKNAGLNDKELQIIYTAPATALASLRAGRVDSAFLFEPYDSMARAALPVGAYTEFYWTVNARALMNFLSLRAAEAAQREIRLYAEACERFFAERMPVTHEAFVASGRAAP